MYHEVFQNNNTHGIRYQDLIEKENKIKKKRDILKSGKDVIATQKLYLSLGETFSKKCFLYKHSVHFIFVFNLN